MTAPTRADARHLFTGSAFVVPLHPLDGSKPVSCLVRPDDPTVPWFQWPLGSPPRLTAHPRSLAQLRDPSVSLYVVENPLQGDHLVSRGLCAISVCGIYGRHADWRAVALAGRDVHICMPAFDGPGPIRALTAVLESYGARVLWSPETGPGWSPTEWVTS